MASNSFSQKFSRESIFSDFMSNNMDDSSEDEILVFGKPAKRKSTKSTAELPRPSPSSQKARPERRKLEARYKCTYCEKLYKLRGALDRHVRSKHLDEQGEVRVDTVKVGKKSVLPDKSPVKRTTKKKGTIHASSVSQNLGKRIELQDGKVVYECNECGKQLAQKNLYRHARTHSNDWESATIDLTEQSPSGSSAMSDSLPTTPLSKPSSSSALPKQFQCDMCDKRFRQKCNLQRHHTSMHYLALKPFKCRFCHKRLTSKQSLRKHEKSHTQSLAAGLAAFERLDVQWCCKFCKRNDFANWDEMDEHRLSEHPELTKQMHYELAESEEEDADEDMPMADLVSVSDSSQTSCSFSSGASFPPIAAPQIESQFAQPTVPMVCNADDSDVYIFSDSD